jgi:kynurenine formamidase
MMRFLSYSLGKTVPGYGNPRKRVEILPTRAINRGDVCDISSIKLDNHCGTHVDCPAHFCKGGKKVSAFPPEMWHFKFPQVISVALKDGELLTADSLKMKINPKTDLLLLKSGWAKFRGAVRYSRKNPGVHASFGQFLRTRFPRVRAIGFDWVSLSSFLYREEGWAAHRAFLNPKAPGSPVLILEDMDLRGASSRLKEVWALPLRIEGVDSAPCTVIGVFR